MVVDKANTVRPFSSESDAVTIHREALPSQESSVRSGALE